MNAAARPHEDTQARLIEFINAGWTTQAIAAACELDLPDRLASAARTAGELAQDAGADLDALTRLLRALVTLEVCDETALGTFALGSLGQLLRRGHEHGLRHWALLNGGPLWVRWGALSSKVREGHRPRESSGSAERFHRLAIDEWEARLFHGAMTELSGRLGDSLADALTVRHDALVVDVGGGAGEVLASVLVRHPKARGLLFDLSHALAHAPAVLGRRGVNDRCALQAGSFFDHVPPQGDIYLMKSVLHDWDDEHAVRLLCRCREAMKSDARLVIVERPMPERIGATPEHRALVRSDLNMLVGLAGRERSLAKYRALLKQAGLALLEVQTLVAGFTALEVAIAGQTA